MGSGQLIALSPLLIFYGLSFLIVAEAAFPYYKFEDGGNYTCNSLHLCLPLSNVTLRFGESKENLAPIYDFKSACDGLVAAGIGSINFWGDSYIRHVLHATALLLSNDYDDGAVFYSKHGAPDHCQANECRGEHIFSEKHCAYDCGIEYKYVCENKVLLDSTLYRGPPGMNDCDNYQPCSHGKIKALIWSEGNHPTDHDYTLRTGVNNASTWIDHFHQDNYGPCNGLMADSSNRCPLMWLSTHQRVEAKFADENASVVETFNEGMRDFFEDGNCGAASGYLDVFNFTQTIVNDYPEDAKLLTYDNVHWKRTVNLMKVQVLIHYLITKKWKDDGIGCSKQLRYRLMV